MGHYDEQRDKHEELATERQDPRSELSTLERVERYMQEQKEQMNAGNSAFKTLDEALAVIRNRLADKKSTFKP